jgi:hypothetical protein
MATKVLIQFAAWFSEFFGGFNGTCTQAALAICIGIAKGKPATQDDMLFLVHDMLQKKLCGPNGAATLHAAAEEARDVLGGGVLIEWDYTNPLGHDWAGTLTRYAGVKPILLQVLNGQALHDANTGSADESGLHAHAIAVLGMEGQNFICADGDNPEVSKQYQVYSLEVLTAAQPCGLLMLDTFWEHVPAGWKDDGKVLTAPNGVAVAAQFRQMILDEAGWDVTNMPLAGSVTEDFGKGVTETYQTFTYAEYRSRTDDHDGAPFLANIGADVLKLRAMLAQVRAALVAVQGVVA